jgi:hypothetical protein
LKNLLILDIIKLINKDFFLTMINNKTLTNLIHEQIILFLLSKNSNIYEAKRLLNENEKAFINKVGELLCNKEISNDKDLYQEILNISNSEDKNNFLIQFFEKEIININNFNESDRWEKQAVLLSLNNDKGESESIENFYYFSNKREDNLENAMKNGTLSGSKAFRIIRKDINLKEESFLESDYINLYLTKYNLKNKKEFGKAFNIPIIPEDLFSLVISILTFFSKYYKGVYFDYKNQSKLEIITEKLLKVINSEKYKNLNIKYLVEQKNNEEDKSIGVIMQFLDAQNIEEKNLSFMETSEEKQQSFINTLAESFILDICDRTTMFNMMIHQNDYINIDYGLKYIKNDHVKVIENFCKALRKRDIEKAKEVFLSEIKEETEFKTKLFERQGVLTGNSNDKLIEERRKVYNFAKEILDQMSDEKFISIFSDLLNEEKVKEIQSIFKEFYLKEKEYKKNHCDVGKCVKLIFDSVEECKKPKSKLQ